VLADDARELMGINTVDQLVEAERIHATLAAGAARDGLARLRRLWSPWRMAWISNAAAGDAAARKRRAAGGPIREVGSTKITAAGRATPSACSAASRRPAPIARTW